MAEIFVSFVHEEQSVAEALRWVLREAYPRATVFVSADQWQVFAGQDWLQRIRGELAAAQVVILLLSERSVSRPWVNFEAGAAWLTDKTIIPVCLGTLDIDHLPKPYSNFQAVKLPEGTYYLLTSLGHHLRQVSPIPGFVEHSEWFPGLKQAIDDTFGGD